MITEAKKKDYVLTDHLVIHLLELPKIKNLEISSKIDCWLLYLRKEGQDDSTIIPEVRMPKLRDREMVKLEVQGG